MEDLKDVIPAFAKLSRKKVQSAIQAGADRLLSMQLPNGSFTYWPGGTDTVDWATPYAGMGLLMARRQAANVPDAAIESLSQYLIESLRGLADTKSALRPRIPCPRPARALARRCTRSPPIRAR